MGCAQIARKSFTREFKGHLPARALRSPIPL